MKEDTANARITLTIAKLLFITEYLSKRGVRSGRTTMSSLNPTAMSSADADQFRAELTERMKGFHLELHPEKTRLLKFGPHAIDQRQWRGEGKPETFNFLGLRISA